MTAPTEWTGMHAISHSPSSDTLSMYEVSEYLLQLHFGDQTRAVDATKVLRNFNFTIACNIWFFIHDPHDEDLQWNMIIPLNDDQKRTANTQLSTSHHQYKATKHQLTHSRMAKTLSCSAQTICRIPNALRIGIQTGLEQTADSAALIVLGGFAVIISNVVIPRNAIQESIEHPSLKQLGMTTAVIPLWACASLVAATLGSAACVAAVPLTSVGRAACYLYSADDSTTRVASIEQLGGMSAFTDVLRWLVDTRIYETPKFKQLHSFEQRKRKSERIRHKYPNRIPVVCEKRKDEYFDGVNNAIFLDIKTKYLVPDEITFGQLMYVIRKKVRIPPELAIFGFVAGSVLPSTAQVLSEIYREYKDEDGFLYVVYQGEHCYG